MTPVVVGAFAGLGCALAAGLALAGQNLTTGRSLGPVGVAIGRRPRFVLSS